MELEILITIITASALIVGALIGIFGQLLSNWINHKSKINFLIFETFFNKRIIYIEKLSLEVEKIIERESAILFLISSIGNKIGNKKVTLKHVKQEIKKTILDANKEKMNNFRLSGKSIYFSDNSPIVPLLKDFIIQYSNTMLILRNLYDNGLKDLEVKSKAIIQISQDLVRGQNLLKGIKKEIFSK